MLVPSAPLVIVVKFGDDTPVYEINSSSTNILPAELKFVVASSVIDVPDPPVPLLSFNSAPSKVDVAAPDTDPSHCEIPQP